MIENLIISLKKNYRFKDRIEHIEIIPERKPYYGRLKEELSNGIKEYLRRKDIKLYKHQCDAIEKLHEGKNIIITTPTASGKTLAFNIPVIERLEIEKDSTALYLYPAKALSNDQLKVIKEFENISKIKINPSVYDGDTPKEKRPLIRDKSRIIISNPYEIHQVLPWHYKWEKFLRNLKFVVIDEAHRYRGVFGSNFSFLMRRFRRLCNLYGSKPQFILSSATLANPVEFSNKLTGLDFELISEDGSPKGKKYFILYNPYYDVIEGRSAIQDTKDLFLFFIRNNLQTLCFTFSRKTAEVISLLAKEELRHSDKYLEDKITSYRAGYLPDERREIENKLKNGDLLGLVSTNALELGIDIGSLDCVIISGYPGTVISTWQQAGRAGRGANVSCAVLVAFQNPLDQYFMRHPETFFESSHEHAIIDLKNPYIMSGHILCASAESPVKIPDDKDYLGSSIPEYLLTLKNEGLVKETQNGWVYSGKGRATDAVSLDNISSENFTVLLDGELVETMDRHQMYREAHIGAVLLHQGETYLVEVMDLNNRIIRIKKQDVDYYTEPINIVNINMLREISGKKFGDFPFSFGELEVTEKYIGYRLKKFDRILKTETLDLPPIIFKTEGLWLTIPEKILMSVWEKRKKEKDTIRDLKSNLKSVVMDGTIGGALHGIEHAMISIIPFYVMCERDDIGGFSIPKHPYTNMPTIIIYDGKEGGIGLSEKAFELIDKIIKTTYELVRDCRCEEGCPACIYSPKCGNENRPLDKSSTILLLFELIEGMKEFKKEY